MQKLKCTPWGMPPLRLHGFEKMRSNFQSCTLRVGCVFPRVRLVDLSVSYRADSPRKVNASRFFRIWSLVFVSWSKMLKFHKVADLRFMISSCLFELRTK